MCGFFIRRIIISILVAISLISCGKTKYSDAEHVQRAKQYQEKGDYRSTYIELKNALQLNPRNSDARILLGEYYILVGNGYAAEKELKQAYELGVSGVFMDRLMSESLLLQRRFSDVIVMLDKPDVVSQPNLLVVKAQAYIGLGDVDLATNTLKQAINIEPETELAQLWLARIDMDRKAYSSALQKVKYVLGINSKNAEAWLVYGDISSVENKLAAAMDAYQHAIDMSPKEQPTYVSMGAYSGLARMLIRGKKYEQAEQHIKYLLSVASKFAVPNYLAAVLAYEKKEYEKARDYLQIVMKLAPNDISSILLLGSTNYVLGNLEQAGLQLSQVINEKPDFLAARMLLASVKLKQQQSEYALDLLEPALAKAPNDVRLLSMIGEAALQSGDLKRGRIILKSAVNTHPDEAELRKQLALIYLAEGSDSLANTELQKVIKSGGGAQKEQVILAISYLKLGKYENAVNICQQMVLGNPQDPFLQNFLGLVYQEIGDFIKAREAFMKSLRINANYLMAAVNLARLDMQVGNYKSAQSRIDSVLLRDEKNIFAILTLAQLSARENDFSQAVAWLEHARKIDNKTVIPRLILAKHYANTGQFGLATVVAKEAKQLAATDVQALNAVAKVELTAKEYAAAIQTFSRILELAPQADTYYWLSIAHVRQNNLAEARASIINALKLQPDHLRATALLASIYLNEGNYTEAMGQVIKIQQKHPTSPVGYELEGDLLIHQNQGEKALQALRIANQKSGNSRVAVKIATILYKRQGRKVASSYLTGWLGKNPLDHKSRHLLATIYDSAGDHQKAINEFYKILEHTPNDVMVINDVAWLLYKDNQYVEALRFAQKAYDLSPEDGVILDTYGWVLLGNGQTKVALGMLKQAVDKQPGKMEVLYHYAAALVRYGRKDEAVQLMLKDIVSSKQKFDGKKEARRLLKSIRNE